MRAALIAGCGVVALLLGCVQLAAMSLYGDLAQAPAIPLLIAPAVGIALGRPAASARAPAALRIAYAQALLHRGATAEAAALVENLPDGPDAADLRGQLAERHGDPGSALTWYARARDFERAQRLIDVRESAGDLEQARRLESELVDVLGGYADAGVRARALWRLGQITQEQAVLDHVDPHVLELRALSWYERALALAPNEETYLLAAGQQALTIGDKPAAARYYRRALEAVPNSADARAGLARARS
jgi:tetratricopeptide (TPR) repeat protein